MKNHPERVGLGVVLLLPAIVLLWLSNPAWDTPTSATAYYSVLAFLCVTIAVSAANKTRLNPSPSNNMLFAATTYASFVFAGAAIFYIISSETPVIHAQTSGVFLNLVALASAGIMMFLYSSLDRIIKKENSFWHRRVTPYLIVGVSIIIFVLLMIVVRLPLDQSVFLIAGYVTGSVAVISFVGAAFFTFRQRSEMYANDPVRLSFAFLLFAAASINHIIILTSPTSLWIISIALMALGLLIANVAVNYTFLKEIGISDRTAYLMTIATSILAIVPFILAHLINAALTASPMPDIGATLVIHYSGAVLAGVSALALYIKTKDRPSPDQIAIIFMIIFWMVSEIALVVSQFSPIYGFDTESLVPYVSGGVAATITLFLAVRRVLNPTKLIVQNATRFYVIGVIIAPLIIIGAEYLRNEFLSDTLSGILGPAVMLALSYLSLYALLTYIILQVGASGGKFTINSIGAGLATIWVIVVILKANFAYATPGWWVAEAVMLASTTAFSLVIIGLYLAESQKTEKEIPRASAYSQLLSESIVAHQKTAIDSLTQLTMDSAAEETKLDFIAHILTDISRANEHAKHLETVISGDSFQPDEIEPMDLRNAIDLALSRSNIPETVRWKDKEVKKVQTCLVMANYLLVDVFYNIFQGITERIGVLEFAEVDFGDDGTGPLCTVVLDMIVRVDDIDEVVGLLRRYMIHSPLDVIEFAYMKRLVELFNGSIEWKTEVASGESLYITMVIGLPRAEQES